MPTLQQLLTLKNIGFSQSELGFSKTCQNRFMQDGLLYFELDARASALINVFRAEIQNISHPAAWPLLPGLVDCLPAAVFKIPVPSQASIACILQQQAAMQFSPISAMKLSLFALEFFPSGGFAWTLQAEQKVRKLAHPLS